MLNICRKMTKIALEDEYISRKSSDGKDAEAEYGFTVSAGKFL